jgi:hypothetical protein
MPIFRSPQINLYSRDLSRAALVSVGLGFTETFRTPEVGAPVHIELKLDSFTQYAGHRYDRSGTRGSRPTAAG